MNSTEVPRTPGSVLAPDLEFIPRADSDGLLRITPLLHDGGLLIEGELDRATLPTLTQALASMGGASFSVDLSGLAFTDVGGLRALVTAAADLHDGDVLTLRSVPWHVRRVLHLTGWHNTPGLHLHAPTPLWPESPPPRS